jgi:uncharacterized membrane protein YuzA (DUF378 family)
VSAIIIALVARLFGVSPAVAQVIAIMIAIAVALGGVWGGYEYIKHQGVVEERARIDKDNQDATDKAFNAARSFDDCVAASGVWDFRRQKCLRP